MKEVTGQGLPPGVLDLQCPPPPLDKSVAVRFAMASETLGIGLYEVWARGMCLDSKPVSIRYYLIRENTQCLI